MPDRAGIVCRDGADLLVVVSGVKKLGLPKGHLEKNEDIWECAVRETHEETGVLFDSYDDSVVIDGIRYFIVEKRLDHSSIKPIDTKEINDAKIIPIGALTQLINTSIINRSLRKYVEKHPDTSEAEVW